LVVARSLVTVRQDDDTISDTRPAYGGKQQCSVWSEIDPVDGDEDRRHEQPKFVRMILKRVIFCDRGQKKRLCNTLNEQYPSTE
jgi:hypothetical protein